MTPPATIATDMRLIRVKWAAGLSSSIDSSGDKGASLRFHDHDAEGTRTCRPSARARSDHPYKVGGSAAAAGQSQYCVGGHRDSARIDGRRSVAVVNRDRHALNSA